MAKIHAPSITRATMLYAATLAVWLWARTPMGQAGQPPYATLGLLVLAMIAGPVALINFWNIVWGSFRTQRSVPVFFLEFIYSVLIPGLFFALHIMRMIR